MYRLTKIWTMALVMLTSSPVLSQHMEDYHWVTGYASASPSERFGGTEYIFNSDSLRLVKKEFDANFYVTNSSICDDIGSLKLYTNGCAIYNDKHDIISNGNELNPGIIRNLFCPDRGYSSTTSTLMLGIDNVLNGKKVFLIHRSVNSDPAPGISIGAKYLYLTEITDAFKNDPIVTKKNIPILDTLLHSAHLSAISHINQRDWWIIQPGRFDNKYFTILLTENGVDTLFRQYGKHSFLNDRGGGGQSTFSPNGKMYARKDSGLDGVLLFDFDRSTGLLSNYINIPVSDRLMNGGIAFSPNSRFLYVAEIDKVYQFDLESVDIGASKVVVAEWDGFVDPFPTNFFLCNLGPDCRIYINSSNGVGSMHVIQYPDRKGLACELSQHGIRLPTHNAASMPNFPHFRVDEDWPCDSTIGLRLTPIIELPDGTVEFNIFPNPATDIINLEYNLENVKELFFSITDIMGRTVHSSVVSHREFNKDIDISNWSAGVYLWRLSNLSGIITSGKVVVE